MHIINIRPVPGDGTLRANFDAQVTDQIALFDLNLRVYPDGAKVFAGKSKGRTNACAYIAPALSRRLASLAMSELRGRDQ